MALYSLKKKPVVIKDDRKEDVASSNQVTLWEGIEKKKRFISRSLTDSKWTGFIIPLIFILLGAALLSSQLFPEILSFIQSRFANNSDNVSVVSDDYYKDKINMISSPQSGYFSEVLAHSLTLKSEDTVSATYSKDFFLSIPKIGTNKARIKANIKSDVEAVYKKALENSLAHFKGSPIPGQSGNTFIYGHSITESVYRDNPNNPVVEFTKLGKFGDKIYIDIDDKRISYTVNKVKIINPDETDILNDQGGKTITLMTCYPFGSNSKRLVVVANQD
jgi:LPXTG-site transpeptidase (sortase) family protein